MGYNIKEMSKVQTMEEVALEFGLPQSWVDENLKGIKVGVAAMKAGRVTPWEQVEQEIFGDNREDVRKMARDFGLPQGWIDENIPEDGQAGRGDFGH